MTANRVALALVLAASILFNAHAVADQTDARLDPLFAQLAESSDSALGNQLSVAIWSIWMQVDNRESERHLHLGVTSMDRGNYGAALEHFSRVIENTPAFAEGWNRRATVHYLRGDYIQSARDIKETLLLEPRHFGALAGLGMVMMQLSAPTAAITAFERALIVNPHLYDVRFYLERLQHMLH